MLTRKHFSSLRTLIANGNTPRPRGRGRRVAPGSSKGRATARCPRGLTFAAAQVQILLLSARQERSPAAPGTPAPLHPVPSTHRPPPASCPLLSTARREPAAARRGPPQGLRTCHHGALSVPANTLTFDVQDTGCPLTLGFPQPRPWAAPRRASRGSDPSMPGPPAPPPPCSKLRSGERHVRGRRPSPRSPRLTCHLPAGTSRCRRRLGPLCAADPPCPSPTRLLHPCASPGRSGPTQGANVQASPPQPATSMSA